NPAVLHTAPGGGAKRLARAMGSALSMGRVAGQMRQHRLRENTLLAKSVRKRLHPHFLAPIPYFVTSSIVFFYIYSDLFSRSLWITSAFSAVRFNVHAIYRSHIGHIARNFYHLP
ncbi:hypothetical protein QCW82_006009, partial [Klebsiella michiganensis]